MKNESSLLHKDFKITLPKINRKWVLLLAPLTVAAWLLVVYAVNGIFPFGSGSVVTKDLYCGGLAAYHYVWDAWHTGNLSYDYLSACGFGRDMWLSLFTPSNLFIVLFPRNMIYQALSLLAIIKFTVVAAAAAYAFSHIFKNLPSGWLWLVSFAYTFCGYNIMYFTNLDWLDTVALYPLLIMFALRMFGGKSQIPYFAILAYLFVFNIYMAWFVTLSLVVFGGVYIFAVLPRVERSGAIFKLGTATGAALIAGAYSIYGFVKSLGSSQRFSIGEDMIAGSALQQGSGNPIREIMNTKNVPDIVSFLMFMGTSFAIAFFVLLAVRSVKNKECRKHTVFFGITLALLVLQMCISAVNLLWHGGSFNGWTFRNGYMVGFYCCCIVGYYTAYFNDVPIVNYSHKLLQLIPYASAAVLLLLTLSYANVFFPILSYLDVLGKNIIMQTATDKYPTAVFSAFYLLFLITVLFFKNKKLRNAVVAVAAVLVIVAESVTLINKSTTPGDKLELKTYENCVSVGEVVKGGKLDRVNNADMVLMFNYPYMAGVPAITNWTHSLTSQQLASVDSLGFSTQYTMTLDTGGTAFTKALLHITDSVAVTPVSPLLCDYVDTTSTGIDHYKNKYVIPIGAVFDSGIADAYNTYDAARQFEYQNKIYGSLTDGDILFNTAKPYDIYSAKATEKLMGSFPVNEAEPNGEKELRYYNADYNIYKFKIDTAENSALYMQYTGEKDRFSKILYIKVNGETLNIPSFVYSDEYVPNEVYPSIYNRNIIELGTFGSAQAVEFEIKLESSTIDNLSIYQLDLNKLKNICSTSDNYEWQKDTISFTTDCKYDSGIIFVPLAYDAAWHCTVNGEPAETVCILGDFMGIKAAAGVNNVEMHYATSHINIIILAVSFIAALIFLLIIKRFKAPAFMSGTFYAAFTLVFAAATVLLYAVPVGVFLLNVF